MCISGWLPLAYKMKNGKHPVSLRRTRFSLAHLALQANSLPDCCSMKAPMRTRCQSGWGMGTQTWRFGSSLFFASGIGGPEVLA